MSASCWKDSPSFGVTGVALALPPPTEAPLFTGPSSTALNCERVFSTRNPVFRVSRLVIDQSTFPNAASCQSRECSLPVYS